jgi:hypothetical protein
MDSRTNPHITLPGGTIVLTLRRALALALIGLLVPSVGLAAPSPVMKTQRVILHVPTTFKNDMRFKHVMASATLKAGKMDTTINLTTENLPAPSTLKAKTYVLWVVNGSKKQAVGALKLHGAMAGLKTSTMWHTIQDLVVTAERSKAVMHPMGQVVLSGMVG